MISFKKKKLKVFVFDKTESMADQAAEDVTAKIKELQNNKTEINIIFSGAESQELFLRNLAAAKEIMWEKINAFAVDEFISPGMNPDFRVSSQPEKLLYSNVNLKSVNIINYAAEDIEKERERYEEIIKKNPPDIVCLGIGKSGHIAFNEPGQSSFNDSQYVSIMEPDENSEDQLMRDPNFKSLGIIPKKAITVTIPPLMKCPNVFVVTPYKIKAPIIKRLMESDVDESLPASILQTKEGAKLYLDRESYSLCK